MNTTAYDLAQANGPALTVIDARIIELRRSIDRCLGKADLASGSVGASKWMDEADVYQICVNELVRLRGMLA